MTELKEELITYLKIYLDNLANDKNLHITRYPVKDGLGIKEPLSDLSDSIAEGVCQFLINKEHK